MFHHATLPSGPVAEETLRTEPPRATPIWTAIISVAAVDACYKVRTNDLLPLPPLPLIKVSWFRLLQL